MKHEASRAPKVCDRTLPLQVVAHFSVQRGSPDPLPAVKVRSVGDPNDLRGSRFVLEDAVHEVGINGRCSLCSGFKPRSAHLVWVLGLYPP